MVPGKCPPPAIPLAELNPTGKSAGRDVRSDPLVPQWARYEFALTQIGECILDDYGKQVHGRQAYQWGLFRAIPEGM